MPKTQEKIKVLRGTRANIAAVAANSSKKGKFKLHQGELALDVDDGYLIAGLSADDVSGNPTNDIDDTEHIVKTNELVGYKEDASGNLADDYTHVSPDAEFDPDEDYFVIGNATYVIDESVTEDNFDQKKSGLYIYNPVSDRETEYSVRFTDADNKLTIKNENGDIDTTAHSSVNVTAQNGDITETAHGEVNVTAQGGDVDIDASESVTVDANGGNIVLTSKHSYLSAASLTYDEEETYYEKSGNTYVEANPPVADETDFNSRKANLYIANIGENGDGKIVLNSQTNLSEDGKTLKVGDVTIDGNTDSSMDVRKITNGASGDNGYVDINKITNLGNVQGELASGSTTIRTLLNNIGSGNDEVEGIEFETNTADAQSNAKESSIRTDNLETDTIKSRAETDLDIQSKGSGKVIKLNTNTTISRDGKTLKVDNGEDGTGGTVNHNTRVTPEDIKVDLIQPSTTDVRTKIEKNYLNNTTSIVGSNGVWKDQELAIGSYSRGTVYSVGDWIKNDNKYYRCKTAYTAATEIFDPTNWDDKTFDVSTIYANNDLVGNNDKIYKYIVVSNTHFIKINSDTPSNKEDAKDGVKIYTAPDGESTIYSDKYAGKLNTSSYNNPGSPGTEFKMLRQALLDMVYPVGSIYMSMNSDNPSTFLGGSWERIQDYFLYAGVGEKGSSSTSGGKKPLDYGGSNDASLVSHSHTYKNASGTADIEQIDTNGVRKGTSEEGLLLKVWFHGLEGANLIVSGAVNDNPKLVGRDTNKDIEYSGSNSIEGINPDCFMAELNHVHSVELPTISTEGANKTDKNMPQYLAVYMWERTA